MIQRKYQCIFNSITSSSIKLQISFLQGKAKSAANFIVFFLFLDDLNVQTMTLFLIYVVGGVSSFFRSWLYTLTGQSLVARIRKMVIYHQCICFIQNQLFITTSNYVNLPPMYLFSINLTTQKKWCRRLWFLSCLIKTYWSKQHYFIFDKIDNYFFNLMNYITKYFLHVHYINQPAQSIVLVAWSTGQGRSSSILFFC